MLHAIGAFILPGQARPASATESLDYRSPHRILVTNHPLALTFRELASHIPNNRDDSRKGTDITSRGDRIARLQRLQHFAYIPFVEMLPVSGPGCRIGFGLKP